MAGKLRLQGHSSIPVVSPRHFIWEIPEEVTGGRGTQIYVEGSVKIMGKAWDFRCLAVLPSGPGSGPTWLRWSLLAPASGEKCGGSVPNWSSDPFYIWGLALQTPGCAATSGSTWRFVSSNTAPRPCQLVVRRVQRSLQDRGFESANTSADLASVM